MIQRDASAPPPPANNAAAEAAMLLSHKFDDGRRNWSVRTHICYFLGALVALWIFCYGATALLVEALLRVTT